MRSDRARPGLDAFEGLVDAHAQAAYRVAVALVGEARAADLVRAAFLVAWRRLPPGLDPGRFGPWLQRIVVTTGRSMLHRRDTVREIPAAGSAPQAAFAELPDDTRAVIALRHAAGLTPHEVALALEVRDELAVERLGAAVRALGRAAGLPEQRWPGRGEALHPDTRVETFLASLGETPVPRGLAASVVEHVRANPRRPPSARLAVLAGAAGLLTVVAAAAAAGLHLPIDVFPGPSAAPSTALGPYLRSEAVEFAEILRPGAAISAAPGDAALLRTTIDDVGLRVLVVARQQAGDRTWAEVELERPGEEATFVWMPQVVRTESSGADDLPVLRVAQPDCPAAGVPSAGLLVGLTGAERLACVHGGAFTIGPVWVDEAEPTAGVGTPTWLAGPATLVLATDLRAGHRFDLGPLRVDPASGLVIPTGAWLRVRLHMDDPAAAGCVRTRVEGGPLVGGAADQALWCRQQLVLEAFTHDLDPSTGFD